MTATGDVNVVERFVLRARRIEAHSLVQHREELARHVEGSFEGEVDVSGSFTFRRRLPPEEVFESLAARVRPLTLGSEPIFYTKVLAALEGLIQVSGDASSEQMERFGDLRGTWQAAELQGRRTQAYAIQAIRQDGTEGTPLVSDTQLAAGWMYADLVHADPTGPKAEALLFPLRERYAAAVRTFSRIAALAVSTLRLIESLRDSGVISIGRELWDQDVVIGVTELVQEGKAFTAPPGTDVPDLRDAGRGMPAGWTHFTVTDLLRQDLANRVRVRLDRATNTSIAEYDAAVAHQRIEDDVLHWQVLVAGSVLFHFEFQLEGDRLTRVRRVGSTHYGSTNRLLLAADLLTLQMHDADVMSFELGAARTVAFEPPSLDDEQLRHVRVHAEVVADIVAIEDLASAEFEPCTGDLNDLDRLRLRQTRLLLQGEIVETWRQQLRTTVFNGRPPQVIVLGPGSLQVGGSTLRTPTTYLRHPRMRSRELGPAPDAGPEAREFEVAPPEGERFLAWSPSTREVAGDGDLVVTSPWGLLGIDESTFPF